MAPYPEGAGAGRAAAQTIPVNSFIGSSSSAASETPAAPRAFEPGESESLASEEPSADRAFTHDPRCLAAPRAPHASRRLRLARLQLLFTRRLRAGVGEAAAASGDALLPAPPNGHAEGDFRADAAARPSRTAAAGAGAGARRHLTA